MPTSASATTPAAGWASRSATRTAKAGSPRPSRTCETLLRGGLVARFYYIYAVDYDRGGEWSGQAFLCSREKEFTIRGIDNSLARGYDRTGFFEVDTGEQRTWTVQLTDTAEQGPERPLLPLGPMRAPPHLPPPPNPSPSRSPPK